MFKTMEKAQKMNDTVILFRRELHQIAELGFDLEETSQKIRLHLNQMGIESYKCGKCGIIAMIDADNVNGPVIGIRADMDGLPVQEKTGLAFASKHKGAMHCCGHDAHMAILLGVAKLLSENRKEWNGRVKLFFQPAEELVSGALDMIENGALENPNVDLMLGLHIWQPLESGKVGIKNGPIMASVDHFKITIFGKGAHGAMPHEGIDAIASAADFIQGIQHLLTRAIPSNQNYILSFGKISGGVKDNAIAEEVIIKGTFRTFNAEARNIIEQKIKNLLDSQGLTFGIKWEYVSEHRSPATINNYRLTERVRNSIIKVIGKDRVIEYGPVMAAEDFGQYGQHVPSVFFFLGTGNEKCIYPHHHSKFDIDEETLPIGAASLLQSVIDLSNSQL